MVNFTFPQFPKFSLPVLTPTPTNACNIDIGAELEPLIQRQNELYFVVLALLAITILQTCVYIAGVVKNLPNRAPTAVVETPIVTIVVTHNGDMARATSKGEVENAVVSAGKAVVEVMGGGWRVYVRAEKEGQRSPEDEADEADSEEKEAEEEEELEGVEDWEAGAEMEEEGDGDDVEEEAEIEAEKETSQRIRPNLQLTISGTQAEIDTPNMTPMVFTPASTPTDNRETDFEYEDLVLNQIRERWG
jgi:hypothetical protein